MTVVAELFTKVGWQVDTSSAQAAAKSIGDIAVRAQQLRQQLAGLKEAGVPKPLTDAIARSIKSGENRALAQFGAAGAGLTDPKETSNAAAGLDLFRKAAAGFLALRVVNEVRQFGAEMRQLGNETTNLAERFGISVKTFQQLDYAAKTTGLTTDQLRQALSDLQKNGAQFVGGQSDKSLTAAFQKLGVAASDLKGLSVDKQLALLADGFQKIEDPAQRTQIAVKLFEEEGGRLVPLLAKGSKGIAELRKEAIALGGGLSEEAVKGLKAWDIGVKQLEFAALSLKGALATTLLPTLLAFTDAMKRGALWLADFQKQTDALSTLLVSGLALGLAKVVMYARELERVKWISAAKFLAVAAAIAAVIALLDDLYGLFTGKKSLIGEWLAQFGYLEKVEGWVRNIQAGLQSITELGFAKAVQEGVGGIGDVLTQTRDAGARQEAERLAASSDPRERELGQRALAGLGERGKASGPPEIMRALGRGVGAKAIDANSTGRLTLGSNSKYAGDVNNIVNLDSNLTVNATTGDIEKIREVWREENQRQVQRLAAMIPRATAQEQLDADGGVL